MMTLNEDLLPGFRGGIHSHRESGAPRAARVFCAVLVTIVAVTWSATSTAQQPELLRDINDRPLGTASSNPAEMVALGNVVICATPLQGLFAIDPVAGTATRLLATGPSAYASEVVQIGNRAYFTYGGDLFETDGTVSGTRAHPIGSAVVSELTPFSTLLFFRWDSPSAGSGLAFVDVSSRPLRMNVFPSQVAPDPQRLIAVGDSVFFTANSPGSGRELYRSDGTLAGTGLFHEFSPGPASTRFGTMAAKYRSAPYAPYLVVGATPDAGGEQLWTAHSAGVTSLGVLRTYQVFDEPGTSRFLLAASDPTGSLGTELYVSHGTPSTTTLVADIRRGTGSSSPSFLGSLGGRVYFSAFEPSTGTELWVTDGTSRGTTLIADIWSGNRSGLIGGQVGLAASLGGSPLLIFEADDGASGIEPWVTDGTGGGTRLLRDIYPGVRRGSSPYDFVAIPGSRVVFVATDRLAGREPWITSGTIASTRLLVDLDPTPGGPVTGDSNPAHGVRYGPHVLFGADDGQRGVELWQTSGPFSTQIRADLAIGARSSEPRDFTIVGDKLFFTAANDAGVRRLWMLRGPSARPAVVSAATIDPSELCAVDELLFFKNQDPATGAELWKSDGTSAGTVLVRDLVAGSGSSDPTAIVAFRGRAIFSATHPLTGLELWSSDGTAAGTRFIREIVQGSGSSAPREMTVVRESVFFSATSSGYGRELWKTNGTAAGTVLVADIRGGIRGSDPTELTRVGERLFCMADDGSRGREVWVSDGTAMGTHIVRDVWPGTTRGALGSLLAGGDLLYFQAMDAAGGPEPWRSDGTPGGTFALGDLQAGVGGSYPEFQAASGSRHVWFSARTADHGRELWWSDGTVAGTQRASDIQPGGDSSDPEVLGVLGHRLVFAAVHPDKGREPFSVEIGATTLSYGYGCGFDRPAPRLSFDDLVLDDFATFGMVGMRPGSLGLLGLSALPLAQPIRMQTGCWLYPDAGSVAVWGPYLASAGAFQLTVLVPNAPILLNRELVWQGIVAPSPSPLGFDTSAAVVTTCGH